MTKTQNSVGENIANHATKNRDKLHQKILNTPMTEDAKRAMKETNEIRKQRAESGHENERD